MVCCCDVHVQLSFSFPVSPPQLCVIHHVTMESVLLMTLASVLVDTVDPHAANQVYLCTVAFYIGWPKACLYVRIMLKTTPVDQLLFIVYELHD